MPVARLRRSLVVLAAVSTLAGVAHADGKDPPGADEASERFRSGVQFYKDGDFTAAQVEFKRAYELSPNWRVLYNLGQTSRDLKDYAAALSAFEQYLREGGKDVPPPRKKDVTGWIAELKNKVGTITVTANVEGAELLLDDAKIGVAPLAAPVIVNVGRHKFSATRAGYRPVQRAIEVAGQQAASVALELAPLDDQQAAAPGRPDAPTSTTTTIVVESKRSVAPWITLAVTGAAAVATGVLGGLALGAHGDLKKELSTFPGDAGRIKAAQDKTRSLAIGADVAGAVTIVGAVATGVLFVIGSGGSKERGTSVAVSPTGVLVNGSF
jgi:hypothetical protein